jgi:hypothetical protein
MKRWVSGSVCAWPIPLKCRPFGGKKVQGPLFDNSVRKSYHSRIILESRARVGLLPPRF